MDWISTKMASMKEPPPELLTPVIILPSSTPRTVTVVILKLNNYKINNQESISLKKLIEIVQPILYDKKKKEGLILSSASPLEYNQMLYTILGKNKKRAYDIQEQLYQLLEVFGQPKF